MMNGGNAGTGISSRPFGVLADGREAALFVLSNANGMDVSITNYGGIVTSLNAPDRHGKIADLVLGFDELDDYLADHPYFGAIVGRYANRIAKGTFRLEGRRFSLATNNRGNHLHGGRVGFDKALWVARIRSNPARLELTHISRDGDEGYPGKLDVVVTYSLSDADELRVDYRATSDRTTHVNLTNHSYFNLSGHDSGNILGHRVEINADRFTPVTGKLIPTGELRRVGGTPMDFRRPISIGARIEEDDEQLLFGSGYDHNWVLNDVGSGLKRAATVSDPASGRVLEVFTSEPGVQFYTANFLDGNLKGKGGTAYTCRSAFCLETQHFPDSPNKQDFPSTILRPGEAYESSTIYRFSAL